MSHEKAATETPERDAKKLIKGCAAKDPRTALSDERLEEAKVAAREAAVRAGAANPAADAQGEGCGACGDACNGGPCRLKAESPVANVDSVNTSAATCIETGGKCADAQGVEALLRSENPDRKDFTVDEALSIADKHEAAHRHIPSVSRTLAAEVRRLTAAGVNQKLTTDDGEQKPTAVIEKFSTDGSGRATIILSRELAAPLVGAALYAQPTAERGVSDVLRIPRSESLDPINLYFDDTAPGQGRITIACFGDAWTAAWGAMGDRTVRQFVAECDSVYLTNSLLQLRGANTRLRAYTARIAAAITAALGGQDA